MFKVLPTSLFPGPATFCSRFFCSLPHLTSFSPEFSVSFFHLFQVFALISGNIVIRIALKSLVDISNIWLFSWELQIFLSFSLLSNSGWYIGHLAVTFCYSGACEESREGWCCVCFSSQSTMLEMVSPGPPMVGCSSPWAEYAHGL